MIFFVLLLVSVSLFWLSVYHKVTQWAVTQFIVLFLRASRLRDWSLSRGVRFMNDALMRVLAFHQNLRVKANRWLSLS